ncbi:MAG: hypothetical protein J7497_15410, partial [Chitinophagaceae bacterium]|nr:hypothetical protein [Chitinophagaceae bacterium]
MRNIHLYIGIPFFLLGLFILDDNEKSSAPVIQKDNVIGCAPEVNDYTGVAVNGKFISALPGWGNYSYLISSKSDSAQFYFNQGINMYYGYHKPESMASFKEAARFDSLNAMVYWGQALAAGPSYNSSYAYKMKSTVPALVAKMNSLLMNASAKEQDLIKAINTRYSADTTDSNRKQLNNAYAESMKALVEKYPDDIDIKALYIDAAMMIHEWDFWNNDGSPKAWTPVLVRYCEDILKVNPQHPAALHYYIHVTEASRHPQVALHAADILKDIMPGVAHMVHMSSHEYERMGLYVKGVEVNEKADENLVLYDSLTNGVMTSAHS